MNNEAIAFAKCAEPDCAFEVAHDTGDSGLHHVIESFMRHIRQAHGIKAARP
jgi:predicted small metal-binding protein